MKYRYRVNWRGKVIMQCLDWRLLDRGDKEWFWRDATVLDMQKEKRNE